MTAVVVLGVAGSGKSTVGSLLAEHLRWRYIDADDHHPPANRAKMTAGEPLVDADRWPWLAALATLLDEPTDTVMACSALRRTYRDHLRADRPWVHLVYLHADRTLVADRLSARAGHFFPQGLLDSQFQALEEPADDEDVLTVPADQAPAVIVDGVARHLARQDAAGRGVAGRHMGKPRP